MGDEGIDGLNNLSDIGEAFYEDLDDQNGKNKLQRIDGKEL
jgi:hypothetical protein